MKKTRKMKKTITMNNQEANNNEEENYTTRYGREVRKPKDYTKC